MQIKSLVRGLVQSEHWVMSGAIIAVISLSGKVQFFHRLTIVSILLVLFIKCLAFTPSL